MTRSSYLGAAPIWVLFIGTALLAAIVFRAQPVQAPAIVTVQPPHLAGSARVSQTVPAAAQRPSSVYPSGRAISAPQAKPVQPAQNQAPSSPCRTGGPGPTMHPMCVTGGQVRIGG